MTIYKNGSVKFTLDELNTLSIYAMEAAHLYQREGCNAIAKSAQEMSDKLYQIGLEHGVYAKFEEVG